MMIRRVVIVLCAVAVICTSSAAVAREPLTSAAFSPKQGATSLIVKTIEGAEESIFVAAYSFSSQPIADALIAAYERGIDVRLVLDKSQRKGHYSLAEYVADEGVPTRINSRYAIMHNKFMLIDGETLQLGSFNYTKAAENRNAENVLVIRNRKRLVNQYQEQWQKLWDEAENFGELFSMWRKHEPFEQNL